MNQRKEKSKLNKITDLLLQLHHLIQETIGYPALAVLVGICIIVIYLLWYTCIRNQYSDEAWKIRKKNGRKSIFWYDENGREVYHRPKKSCPPKKKY